MIKWGTKANDPAQTEEVVGADAFETRLGDAMRGERATLGKSLLDVQRELKIKAAYIAAIENADPSAFDTPGFIAGYVRSYARYLNMDPDWAFGTFCRESGFTTAHGMSAKASSPKAAAPVAKPGQRDIFTEAATPFTPENDPFFAGVEPRAIGSVAVLIALIAGLGYGGWSILQEVQRVQFAPVENSPQVLTNIDPLSGSAVTGEVNTLTVAEPAPEAFDRIYRPQALDVPVMVARDAPIASLDPRSTGMTPTTVTATDAEDPIEAAVASAVQVTEGPAPEVVLLAVRPVWVRVRAVDGSVIFEKTLNAGEEYVLPASEEPPILRAGNSGSLFFKVAGDVYGPAGPGTSTAKGVALGAQVLREQYAQADPNADAALARYVAELQPSQ